MMRRRGIFLIEMLVVITVGSVLAGIAVFLLYALRTNHDAGREHLEYCRNINRLAEQFREDVHSMLKTSQQGKETEIDLLPDGADSGSNNAKVRYQLLDDRIERGELQGDKVVRRESYVLGPDVEASIKIQAQGDTTIVSIVISPKEQGEKLYRAAPQRIEAVLGRDLRLSKSVQKPSTEGKP